MLDVHPFYVGNQAVVGEPPTSQVGFPTGFTAFNSLATVKGGAAGPFGYDNATRMVEDTTAANSHNYFKEGFPILAAVPYAVGLFARNVVSAHQRHIILKSFDGPSYVGSTGLFLNLNTGALTQATDGGSGAIVTLSTYVHDWGNGWFQMEQRVQTTIATQLQYYISMVDAGFAETYDGDGTSAIDLLYPYLRRI